jgi:hypothetical protein
MCAVVPMSGCAPDGSMRLVIEISADMGEYLARNVEVDEKGYCLVVSTHNPYAEFVALVNAVKTGWFSDIEAAEGDDGLFELWGPISTPWGPSLRVREYYGSIERSLWRVADLLNRAGIDGTIGPPPAHYPATWSNDPFPKQPRSTLIAHVELSGRAMLNRYGRDPVPLAESDMVGLPVWETEADDLRAVCDRLVRWCLAERGRQRLVALGGELMGYALPDAATIEDAARLVTDTAMGLRGDTVKGYVHALAEDSGTSRLVKIDLSPGVVTARLVWQEADAAVTDSLTTMSELLRELAPYADYGHIRRNLPASTSWNPHGRSSDTRLITERGFIADAFGIQLLGPRTAPKIERDSLSTR